MNRRGRRLTRAVSLVGMLLLSSMAAHAQTTTIPWWVVSNGGVQDATDDRMNISSTLGQPIIFTIQGPNSAGTNLRTYQGFWVPLLSDPTLGVDDGPIVVTGSSRFQFRNYPNPMSTSTMVAWRLEHPGTVQIRLVDMLGREVAMLFNGDQGGGDFSIEWNGRNSSGIPVADGTYILLLSVTDNSNFETPVATERRTLTILR